MKVLVTVPPLDMVGGVANFYRQLFPYLDGKVDFFYFSTSRKAGRWKKAAALVKDVVRFCRVLAHSRYDIVYLNPSLGDTAVLRDGLYCLIARKLFHSKTLIFWHGWEKST